MRAVGAASTVALRRAAAASLMFVLGASGCAQHAPRGAAAGAPRGAPDPAREATTVTLERTPCFGTCPVYALTLTSDGRVVFEGRRFVDSIGTFTAHIAASAFDALLHQFDEQQFFTLDDRYVMGEKNCQPYATDAPTAISSITARGQTKRVEHDAGCASAPARLQEIERAIDQAAGVARWIGRR